MNGLQHEQTIVSKLLQVATLFVFYNERFLYLGSSICSPQGGGALLGKGDIILMCTNQDLATFDLNLTTVGGFVWSQICSNYIHILLM